MDVGGHSPIVGFTPCYLGGAMNREPLFKYPKGAPFIVRMVVTLAVLYGVMYGLAMLSLGVATIFS